MVRSFSASAPKSRNSVQPSPSSPARRGGAAEKEAEKETEVRGPRSEVSQSCFAATRQRSAATGNGSRAIPLAALAIFLVLSSATWASQQDDANIVLEFSATWCGPCQQLSPLVARLERQGCPIRKVDVDRERALAQRFNIRSLPTCVLVINGREADRIVGFQQETASETEARLRQMFDRVERTILVNNTPKTTPGVSTAPTEEKPRFQLPLFGKGKKTEPAKIAAAQEPIVSRANNDELTQPVSTTPTVDPMAASTRIRVKDKNGINFGSGTIIDSRVGRSIILTCGHIFRQLEANTPIEVDVFHGERHQTFVGKALRYDLEADVGLIEIPTAGVLPIAPMAPPGTQVAQGDALYSIGCGGGDNPTKEQLRITALNRYLGPDNVECTGVPVQGRSGGGLFNQSGQVVGVCIAADPKDKRGLYAGLKPVHAILEKAGLMKPAATDPAPLAKAPAREPKSPTITANASQPHSVTESTAAANVTVPTTGSVTLTESSQYEAIQKALQESPEAEVICIVRSTTAPQAASRVVILNRASPKFVHYLLDEMDTQTARRTASLRVPSESNGTTPDPERYQRSRE